MWVKICGITRYEDALLACEAGADAIGLVLTRSRRRVEPSVVKHWVHVLPGVEKVGVFTDEDPAHIAEVAEMLELDALQLHVAPGPEHKALGKRFAIIRAVRDVQDIQEETDFPCRFLLDPSMGSGSVGQWAASGSPFILAGGLTPENVRQAILAARPAGVDVSSGVESSPGIKDRNKVRRFIQEAKA